jgi:hypothetical protein
MKIIWCGPTLLEKLRCAPSGEICAFQSWSVPDVTRWRVSGPFVVEQPARIEIVDKADIVRRARVMVCFLMV